MTTPMTAETLLPCPFCGDAAIHGANDDGRRYVMCKSFCCVRHVRTWSDDDATAAWNTHPGDRRAGKGGGGGEG